jgi:type IV pilus assembly protein PilC
MTHYKYTAITTEQKVQKGSMFAANRLELEKKLENNHLTLLEYNEVSESNALYQKGISRKELINFCMDMEQLSRSGVPIIEGLEDLKNSLPVSHFKNVLANVIESIKNGKKFSEALREFPGVFDKVFISLVEVGEESGKLSRIFEDMSISLKWIDELSSHTKKIMIYPIIVSSVIMGVVSFLMIFLVPKLVPFLKEMGVVLPFQTKLLISFSNFMVNYWYLVIITPIALIITFKMTLSKSLTFRKKWDAITLKLPLFGPLIFKINLARFANYLALMYASGMNILESIKICQNLTENLYIKEAYFNAQLFIEEGNQISEGFARTGIFPPLVIRMIKIGENTGKLDESLKNISYFYDRDVKETIAKLEPALEPLMTLIMGGIMMWVMTAVMSPIYEIMSKVKI